MTGIIHNIIAFYEMRAKALSVLVTNTQRALEEFGPDREGKANEQSEKLQNFVKALTSDVNDTFTRFWFHKERKQRNHRQMTDDEVNSLADFANFVKTLTKDVRSLLTRFQEARDQTLEKEFDKELEQMQTTVKERLKEFDKVLTGTSDNFRIPLSKSVGDLLSCVRKPLKRTSFSDAVNVKVAGSSSEK